MADGCGAEVGPEQALQLAARQAGDRSQILARQGLLDVVPGLDQRMADLSGRLAFYATLLPRQVRWEAASG